MHTSPGEENAGRSELTMKRGICILSVLQSIAARPGDRSKGSRIERAVHVATCDDAVRYPEASPVPGRVTQSTRSGRAACVPMFGMLSAQERIGGPRP